MPEVFMSYSREDRAAAQAFATANGLYVQQPVWFKADNPGPNGNFENNDITPTGVTGATIIPAAAYGTANGKHYVQFNGITGFSGTRALSNARMLLS